MSLAELGAISAEAVGRILETDVYFDGRELTDEYVAWSVIRSGVASSTMIHGPNGTRAGLKAPTPAWWCRDPEGQEGRSALVVRVRKPPVQMKESHATDCFFRAGAARLETDVSAYCLTELAEASFPPPVRR